MEAVIDATVAAAVERAVGEVMRRRRQIVSECLRLIQIKLGLKGRRWTNRREWVRRRDERRGALLNTLFSESSPGDPESFTNYTKMSKGVLSELLQLVTPHILHQPTVTRKAISSCDRLNVTLRYLTTGSTFEELPACVGSDRNTLSIIVNSTCKAIIEVLQEWVMKCPSTREEWKKVSERFANNVEFPHCVGAIDGKHILYQPPHREGSIYQNCKETDSIILMAIVDADYKFLFVDFARAEGMNASSVFRSSTPAAKLESGSLNLPQPKPLPYFDQDMPYVFVGNSAIPLSTNLLTPYPNKKSIEQEVFNDYIRKASGISDTAFGIMSNRFRVLLNPIPLSAEEVEIITYTCILLHNYLLSKKCQHWYVPSQSRGENLEVLHSSLRSITHQGENKRCLSAEAIRDKFCKYFNSTASFWLSNVVDRIT